MKDANKNKGITSLKNVAGIALLLIISFVIAIYSNHFHNDFHFDDFHTIVNNGFVRDIGNIPLFFRDGTTTSTLPSHQGYRPMVTSTTAIDYFLNEKIFGKGEGYNPFMYHLSNFSWFVIIIFLLYWFFLACLNMTQANRINKYFALFGCLLFGVIPIHAETVNYIISRSDILSALTVIASFNIYIYFRSIRKFGVYLLPVSIGMFAKESTIMFAPTLFVFHYLIEQRKSIPDAFNRRGFRYVWNSLKASLPAFTTCILLALFCLKMIDAHHPGGSSAVWYAITQPYIMLHYIIQFFFPFGLSADSDIALVQSIADDRIYIGLAFVLLSIWAIVRTSRNLMTAPIALGMSWYFLMLLPSSSFIPLAEIANDHRPFLSNAGLILSLISLLRYAFLTRSGSKWLVGAFAVLLLVLIGLYSFKTVQRNEIWKTEESLWKDVTLKSPQNGRGWMNFGLTLMKSGNYAEAENSFLKAKELAPNYHILYTNLGILYEAREMFDQAESNFEKSIQLGHLQVEPHYYYGRYSLRRGNYSKAIELLDRALELFDAHLPSLHLLMQIHYIRNDNENLRRIVNQSQRYYPNDESTLQYSQWLSSGNPQLNPPELVLSAGELINQSLNLYRQGKYRDCIDLCFKVLRMDSLRADAYNNICSAYNVLMQYDSAVWACNKALEISPDFTLARNNLNWALDQSSRE